MDSVYSVRQISGYIKNMFAQDFLLGKVSVRGEISNFKEHPTGHLYFTLKDADARLSCVMFAGNRLKGLRCTPKNGMTVVVTGNVDTYEAGGTYQLYARTVTADGEGDLLREIEERKKRLQEMGMFDASFKKPVPRFVKTVGIVTASSGAALHDIVTVAGRRNPYVQLILCPAAVQGENAPASIISAIQRLDAIHPDVMIVGRGGGSQEDLMAFNDEGVARAIFDADTPVISAVGHEVDFSISDLVADLRAATPSQAAELAVFDAQELLNRLTDDENRMKGAVEHRLRLLQAELKRARADLRACHPKVRLMNEKRTLEQQKNRLEQAMNETLRDRKTALVLLSERLNGNSPLKKLSGGYGYLSVNDQPLTSVKKIKKGDSILITLSDGRVKATAGEVQRFREE